MLQVQVNTDHLAFTQLVKRWEVPIKRLCSKVTGDVHLAEDLCQEAFTRVFVRREHYRPGAKFSTWLWRIALNLCYSNLRQARRRVKYWLEETSLTFNAGLSCENELSPDRHLLVQEEVELVRQALLSLPERLRIILVLRHCQAMKLREIARTLEIPETTAASRCAVALVRITRILEREFEK